MAEILVLGPVDVRHGSRSLVFSRQQERFILGVLALEVGRPVATDRLIDLVWGQNPPRSARSVLQTRISELRASLAALLTEPEAVHDPLDESVEADTTIAIESRRSAYVLVAPENAIDAHVFLDRVKGWRDEPSAEAGVRRLRAALALWRGPVFGDFGAGPGVPPLRHTLESTRLTASEELFELELGLGRHAAVADEILRMPTEDLSRERLIELAMTAQFRSGRAAEALRTFDQWRHWLDDEFGTTPGQRVAEIHRSILQNMDPEPGPRREPARTTVEFGGGVAPPRNSTAPRTLPPDVGTFAGRDDEMALLVDWLSGGERIVSITGAPGVGKTALSLRAAYQLVHEFRDGQLFADLRGADGRGTAQPADVLRRFLRALGVDVAAGVSLDDQIDLYRTVLADKNVLVICDNVSQDSQVESLIPPGPGNRMIINGRSRLHSGLATRTIELAVLDQDRAIGLLRLLVGDERVNAEPVAAREIVRLCGRLPLALRIVGARLRARPHWTIEQLVDGLRGEHHRLDQLAHGHLDVRLSIGLSYRDLKPDAKLLLCAMADVDLTHLSGWAAAALLDSSIDDANTVLDELFGAHLADIAGHDAAGSLYQIHDLVRAYALEQSRTDPIRERLPAARRRVYGVYLHFADNAQKHISYGYYLGRTDSVPRWIPDGGIAATLTERPAAWFENERAHVVTLIRRADADGDLDICSLLVRLTSALFEMRRHFDDWLTIAKIGLSAALRVGDRQAWGVLRLLYGFVLSEHGRHIEALDESAAAQEEFRRDGDVNGVAAAATNLALLASYIRTPPNPYDWLEPITTEVDRVTDRGVYAFAMRALGQAFAGMSRFDDADDAFTKSLAAYRTIDAPIGECQALVHQGRLQIKMGDIDRAAAQFAEALTFVTDIGDVSGVAQCLRGLAAADRARGDIAAARARLAEALQLVRQPKPTLAEKWVVGDLKQLDLLDSAN